MGQQPDADPASILAREKTPSMPAVGEPSHGVPRESRGLRGRALVPRCNANQRHAPGGARHVGLLTMNPLERRPTWFLPASPTSSGLRRGSRTVQIPATATTSPVTPDDAGCTSEGPQGGAGGRPDGDDGGYRVSPKLRCGQVLPQEQGRSSPPRENGPDKHQGGRSARGGRTRIFFTCPGSGISLPHRRDARTRRRRPQFMAEQRIRRPGAPMPRSGARATLGIIRRGSPHPGGARAAASPARSPCRSYRSKRMYRRAEAPPAPTHRRAVPRMGSHASWFGFPVYLNPDGDSRHAWDAAGAGARRGRSTPPSGEPRALDEYLAIPRLRSLECTRRPRRSTGPKGVR